MFGRSEPRGEYMRESDQTSFASDVVTASREHPVLAYFTATWCGPCKTMGPALEKAVNAQNGRIICYKYDIDKNQNLAMQMGIQSIPAVFAFFGGNPVDGFMGAKTQGEIAEFIKGVLDKTVGSAEENHLEAGEALLEQGAYMEAMQLFGTHLADNPEESRAYSGMIMCRLHLDDLDGAEALLESVPDSIRTSAPIERARASVDLEKQARAAGPVTDLRKRLDGDPGNHQVRYDLAIALHANGETDSAIDELLEIFRRDSEWNESAAKSQLLRIFESLPPNDPSVLRGRRKLSSLVFA